MLSKFAAALVAVTMFAAPVLAQTGTAPASAAPTTQAAKAAPAAKKVVKVKKHKMKKAKSVKHVKPVKSSKAKVTARASIKSTAPRVH